MDKIVCQEKVVIPLTEADPDPFLFQGDHPIHDGPKAGIDHIPSREPKIEEITCYDKAVQGQRIGILLPAAHPSPSPEPVEKIHELFMAFISGTFQVSVGEKDRLHDFSLFRRKFPRWGSRTFFVIFCSMIGRLSDLELPFKLRYGNISDGRGNRNGTVRKSVDKSIGYPIEDLQWSDVPRRVPIHDGKD
jgi:hypothetical protein